MYTPRAMLALATHLLLLGATVSDGDFLRDYAQTRRFMAGRPAGARATPDGASVIFLRASAREPAQMLFAFDVSTGQTRELLTPDQLLKGAAETLSVAEKARLERMRVSARGFTSFRLSPDGARILVVLSGKPYVVFRATGQVQALKVGPGATIDPQFSPDGTHVFYVRDNDVHVVNLAKNTERRVTRGGTEEKPHGLAEFIAQEEMSRFSGYWPSPDGKQLVFQETDHAGLEVFGIADPMHPENAPDRFPYPRAGKMNAAVRLGLTPVAGGKVTWLSWDAARFPYVATVRWPAKGALTVLVQNREQTAQRLLQVDVRTGKTKLLLEETDAAWLNLAQEFPKWLKDGTGFFWMTEKHGGPEVELRRADGALDKSWVLPQAGYVNLVGYDDASRTLYFSGGPSATQTSVWKVVEGGAPVELPLFGPNPGTTTATLSDNGTLLVASHTSLTQMPTWAVFKVDGTRVGDLPSVAVEPSLPLSVTIADVGGFATAVIRPKDFKAGKKYPVVLNVYGGPGHLEVFHSYRENLLLQWLANQGFIVVKLDGRGTPRRGRDWERSIKFDFASTALDQVAGLKALSKVVPEMDLGRVGTYGWSFGGYLSALLGLTQPELIRASIAGAPVVDWRDYDTHYTERYLGLPDAQAQSYEKSSLLTFAANARTPLLLIHGTADDNVYFLHSLKLSDALFKAGKKHELLPLANFTHMVPEPLVQQRLWERMAQFFKENL